MKVFLWVIMVITGGLSCCPLWMAYHSDVIGVGWLIATPLLIAISNSISSIRREL